MNCHRHWTTELGFSAPSGASGEPVSDGDRGFGPAFAKGTGVSPASPNRAGGGAVMGYRTYRLTETIPAA